MAEKPYTILPLETPIGGKRRQRGLRRILQIGQVIEVQDKNN